MEIELPSDKLYKAKIKAVRTLQIATLAGASELATHAAAPSGVGAVVGLLAMAFAYAKSNIGTHQDYKNAYYSAPIYRTPSEPSDDLKKKYAQLWEYTWEASNALKIRSPRLTLGHTWLPKSDPDYDILEDNSCAFGNENYSVITVGRIDAAKQDDDCKNIISHELGHILNADTDRQRLQDSIGRVRNVAIPLALCLPTQSGLQTITLVGGICLARELGKDAARLLNAASSRMAEYQADKIGQSISQQMGVGKTFMNTWRNELSDHHTSSLYDTHPIKNKRLARLARCAKIKPPN